MSSTEIIRDVIREAATALLYTLIEKPGVLGFIESRGISVFDWLPFETNVIGMAVFVIGLLLVWGVQYGWRIRRVAVNERGITIERISGRRTTCYWSNILVAEFRPRFLRSSWRMWTLTNERIELSRARHLYGHERKVVDEAVLEALRQKKIPIRNEPPA